MQESRKTVWAGRETFSAIALGPAFVYQYRTSTPFGQAQRLRKNAHKFVSRASHADFRT
jgi:hypothetical protein